MLGMNKMEDRYLRKILVTGANGFIGRNLIEELKNRGYKNIFKCTRQTSVEDLENYTKTCEFVFHLAGISRPQDEEEYMRINRDFTSEILDGLKKYNNKCPILVTSSIQAALDNPYGVSKKLCEDLIFQYGKDTHAEVIIYRLTNTFGKWCKPNYNSVIATFCYNVARDIDIYISDREHILELVYIDDAVEELIQAMEGKGNRNGEFYTAPVSHYAPLGWIADTIMSFKECRKNLQVPDLDNILVKQLYSTYLSYLPKDGFSYPLKMNEDSRGSFTEFLRTQDRGQVSVNISKPGITKGNHWHHSKHEKFLVVKGNGLVQFREIGSREMIEYQVSGEKLEVIDIPTGYTHNIINTGSEDMVTVMWANESFDPQKPDTWYEKVDMEQDKKNE